MKKLRWQILIILLTGLIVGILLVVQKPQNQVNQNQPQTGGIYTEALVGNFQRLNPLFDHYNQADRDIDRLIFSSLVKFDPSGQPQPDLAETWGIAKDGLTYNFSIRENILWQDGLPLTVDDIIFTVDLMRSDPSILPSDIKNFWKDVTLHKLDDYNLQFRIPEPFAPFLDYLTFGVLPKHLLENLTYEQIVESTFNLQPIGTGPYKLDHLVVENDKVAGVALRVNETYFQGKPYIEQIIFRFYPDPATAYTAYKDGEVQGISHVTADILPQVLSESNLSLYSGRRPELSLVLLNLNNSDVEFFQDVEVRWALMKAVNRSFLINQVLNGQAILADSPILPDTWSYFSEGPIPFDIDSAIQQLKNAKYDFEKEGDTIRAKDGKYLSFTLSHPDDPFHTLVAQSIQRDWSKLGVEVKLEPLTYDVLIDERLVQRKYQAALVDINLSRSPDPDPYPFWDQAQATGGQNYSQWSNNAASEYLEQARINFDITERTRLYHNFQVVFRKEMPAILLYYPVYSYGLSNRIQGVQMGPIYDPSDRFSTIKDWYLIIRRGTQSDETAVP